MDKETKLRNDERQSQRREHMKNPSVKDSPLAAGKFIDRGVMYELYPMPSILGPDRPFYLRAKCGSFAEDRLDYGPIVYVGDSTYEFTHPHTGDGYLLKASMTGDIDGQQEIKMSIEKKPRRTK